MSDPADHLGLVHSVAKRYTWACGVALEPADLVQLGTLGLLRAVQKFDPDRGVQFSTYAMYWIRQAILRGIKNQRRLVRVPIYQRDYPSEVLSSNTDRLSSAPTQETTTLANEALRVINDKRLELVVRERADGWTQLEIAERLGLSKQRIQQLEREARKKVARRPRCRVASSQAH